jgi:hypothetical protein
MVLRYLCRVLATVFESRSILFAARASRHSDDYDRDLSNATR